MGADGIGADAGHRIAAAYGRRLSMVRQFLIAVLLTGVGASAARAQPALSTLGGEKEVSQNEPVTFTADQVEYDREKGLVITRGHVQAWQDDHVLRADQITFDRNTGVAAASGNVVLLEPDGQTLFADYAETWDNMDQAVMKGMSALLAENGRLAANGARRTAGEINELSRVVYSACDLCARDPQAPPLWQVTAQSAVQDLEHKRIEYSNAELQMYGIPVAYFPFLSAPDPSVKRASGILLPAIGGSSHLGAFFGQPYYWVIDDQSDATFTPMITTRAGPELGLEYRRRFNEGILQLDGSLGYMDGSPQASVHGLGQFSLNDTWRWGFDVSRTSSANYFRAFHFGNEIGGLDPSVLNSQLYLEGFGQGSYSRLDTRFYQGLNGTIVSSRLPFVLPRYEYSYFGQPDAWGGRLSLETGAFNVMRTDGTNTRRANLTLNYERPFKGMLGDLWKITLHGDAAAYNASQFDLEPNFGPVNTVNTARALPQLAVDFRWPFMRDSGDWGIQVIEPIAQIIVAPQAGDSQLQTIPNEDSLDFEFSDANLFGFRRFPGIDRLEGGQRLNVALHGTWYLGGTTLDGLIGQSYRTTKDNLFPEGSGLHDQISDVVARLSLSPAPWLDLMYRTRLDHRGLAVRMADATASVGVPKLRVTGGYFYSNFNPYTFYDQPPPPPPTDTAFYNGRNEITLGASSTWDHYRFSASARRDLVNKRMVTLVADAAYEDECFILDVRFSRRYTSFNGDNGSTALLIQFTLKTIGQFGYRAL
jgi:LPS-assembly protein